MIHNQHQMGTDAARGERAGGMRRLAPVAIRKQQEFGRYFLDPPDLGRGFGLAHFSIQTAGGRCICDQRRRARRTLPGVARRQFLPRFVTSRGSSQTYRIEPCVPKPMAQPLHVERDSYVAGSYANQHSERRLTRAQIVFAFGATDE